MNRRLDQLPIDEVVEELLAALASQGAAVLHAPPGAGKTTRVPPAIADALASRPGQVVVLEPRRVAARAAARRIAAERGWTVGREVGWWIRFERRFRPDTRVVFATEGVLLRWLQRDPFLEGVAAIVFDEFHERTLTSDLSLALVRQVRNDARPDLRVVVMSATLDADPVSAFLGDAPVVHSAGRQHAVEIRQLDRVGDDRLANRVAAAVRRTAAEIDGDLLVFLPGVGEIRRLEEALAPWAGERGMALRPLYGDLPIEEQDAALRPGPTRRVVLATNVAETSVTVEGVRAVIDSGLARQLRFDPATGLDRLDTVRISRAAADQRAGRAGREAPGVCLRLWTAADDLALRPFETPEVRRVDLAGAVLELAAWGEPDPRSFEWFDAPDPDRLARAARELRDLGAVDARGITPLGRRLAALPLAPRLGRLVLEGERLGVARDAALAAALLAERDPFRAHDASARSTSRSDLADRLAALDPRRHARLFAARDQILALLAASAPSSTADAATTPNRDGNNSIDGKKIAEATAELAATGSRDDGAAPAVEGNDGKSVTPSAPRLGPAPSPTLRWKSLSSYSPAMEWEPKPERLLRAIAAAYLDRLCRRRKKGSDRAVMVGGRGVRVSRASAVRDTELFVAVALDAGRAGERSEDFVRIASAVERKWLQEESLTVADELVWDAAAERVVALRRQRFDDLVLAEKEVPIADAATASELLAERASTDLDRALPLTERPVATLLGRMVCLAGIRPDLGLPADRNGLLRAALPALAAGRRSFAELRRAPLAEALLASLPWPARRTLDELAPERLELPSGFRARIDYSDPDRPVLAVRIQELFGVAETPRLAGGRVPLLLHLLAPNGRPQQVTDDLASFWRNAYPQVRKELAGRYPKHAWPPDPLAASAAASARRPPRHRR